MAIGLPSIARPGGLISVSRVLKSPAGEGVRRNLTDVVRRTMLRQMGRNGARAEGLGPSPKANLGLAERRVVAILSRPLLRRVCMAMELKSGQTVKVTINKTINRAGAKKTLERLFMLDKTVSKPMAARSRNFIPLPKRRGGQIWTKRPNKLHPELAKGASATFKATPQLIRDLNSVETFVQVGPA